MKNFFKPLKKLYLLIFGKQVVKDLLLNGHDYCDNCGDWFFVKKPTQRFCSHACRSQYHYKHKKK